MNTLHKARINSTCEKLREWYTRPKWNLLTWRTGDSPLLAKLMICKWRFFTQVKFCTVCLTLSNESITPAKFTNNETSDKTQGWAQSANQKSFSSVFHWLITAMALVHIWMGTGQEKLKKKHKTKTKKTGFLQSSLEKKECHNSGCMHLLYWESCLCHHWSLLVDVWITVGTISPQFQQPQSKNWGRIWRRADGSHSCVLILCCLQRSSLKNRQEWFPQVLQMCRALHQHASCSILPTDCARLQWKHLETFLHGISDCFLWFAVYSSAHAT